MANEQLAKRYLELGALSRRRVGVDTTPVLARGAEAARRPGLPTTQPPQPITINPSIERIMWSRNMTTSPCNTMIIKPLK